MKKRLLAVVIPMVSGLVGCVTVPPHMMVTVDSFPQSANVVCKFDEGWSSVGQTPVRFPTYFNPQELSQGYSDFPCYVQWVSGKKVALEQTRFIATSETFPHYKFHVERPEGGDLSMDVNYDAQMKQNRSTENAARYQANATIKAARIMSSSIPTKTDCSSDRYGNVSCHSY